MGEQKNDINLSELLLKISTDVAEIKSDMSNFKESYKTEKENLLGKIEDVRKDLEKEQLRQHDKIEQLDTDIRALKTAEDKKDAKKWRTVMAFVLTGLGGMLLSRLPEFFLLVAKSLMTGGQ